MHDWLKGTRGPLLTLAVCSFLVIGGLGWATAAALRLESEQLVERAEAEHANRLRMALWRLDSYVTPLLAREDGRPFDHFSTVFAPHLLLDNDGHVFDPGAVVQPSPLLRADLPDWMALHFQLDPVNNRWESPQVPSDELRARLEGEPVCLLFSGLDDRRALRDRLNEGLAYHRMIERVQATPSGPTVPDRTLVIPTRPYEVGNTTNPNVNYTPQTQQILENDLAQRRDYNEKVGRQQEGVRMQRVNMDVANGNLARNGENWFGRGPTLVVRGSETHVQLGRMAPHWFVDKDDTPRLLVVRLVTIESPQRKICQGIVLDPASLQRDLVLKVTDLFPEAQLLPVADDGPDAPLNRMTSLPLQLDPGEPPAVPDPGWTTLRIGLALAWAAALVAILAVGLGGWSLLDLSERRIRFVSAVTHELRTPLTTLRLYLEMLLDGMVRDEKTRQEYLQTLHAEAERLNRLVGNVLDYSRLENRKPNLLKRTVEVADLLGQVRATWTPRCATADKHLLVEPLLPAGTTVTTDDDLVQQILGNLIDNACKYSHGAADGRLWVRARTETGRVIFEVEDRGPGVPARERRCIFSAFTRGGEVDPSTGGVGLGLSLARRWAEMLGGTLELAPPSDDGGACFRLTLPA